MRIQAAEIQKRMEYRAVATLCGALLVCSPTKAGERVLRKEVIVSAPVSAIWKAWTTNEGLESFFCKKANVALKVGGPYELAMTLDLPVGQRGTEGCHVLSYVPERMLSFEWNAPPTIPALRDANALTHVVVEFRPIGGGVSEVRLSQLGWGEGDDWDKCYGYFDRAWSNVLANLQAKIGENAKPMQRTRVLRQEHIINATREEAWRVFTTKEGLEGSIVAHADVDMRVGGHIKTHYDPNGKLGDANTITHHILSYEPGRMYSSYVESPANTPVTRVVQEAWSAVYFDEIEPGRTKMTIAACGWGEGEKWDAAEAFFEKGNAWTIQKVNKYLREKLADRPLSKANPVTPVAELAPFSRLIGVWEALKTDSDGSLFHARVDYEWGLDGKTINSKTYLINDGKPHLTYESAYFWHPGRKKVSFQSHAVWNALYDGTVDINGDRMTGQWRAFSKNGEKDYRLTMEFTDQDTYNWTVLQEQGDAWKPVKDAVWRRQ